MDNDSDPNRDAAGSSSSAGSVRNLNQPPPIAQPTVSVAAGSSLAPLVTQRIDDGETRRNVSYVLLALLSVVVIAAFVALFVINAEKNEVAASHFKQLTELLNIIFGPVIALVSSVVGFYFGSRTATDAKSTG